MLVSPKLDAVYCEPCWLFSEERKAKDNWREHGVRDWRGLSKKIKIHENSQRKNDVLRRATIK